MKTRQGFGLTLSILLTLLVATLCTQLPGRLVPSWLSSQKQSYGILWPQNWAFFSIQADNPTVFTYQISRDGTLTPALISEGARGNLWGLGQSSAAYFIQAIYLAHELPPGAWKPCRGSAPSQCLPAAQDARLDEPFAPSLLCGDTLFIKYPPGSTEASGETANRPEAASRVYVSCG